MSKITTVYNTILTKVAGLFPSKTKIPLPESLPDNDNNLLRDGYGVMVGASTISALDTFKDSNISREFTIVFTEELIRTNHDADSRDTVLLSILEDMVTLKQDFLNFDQLGIDSSIEKVTFVGSSGVEYANIDDFSIMTMNITFSIDISEII